MQPETMGDTKPGRIEIGARATAQQTGRQLFGERPGQHGLSGQNLPYPACGTQRRSFVGQIGQRTQTVALCFEKNACDTVFINEFNARTAFWIGVRLAFAPSE